MGKSTFTLYLFGGSVPWGFPYAPACNIGTIVSQIWSGSVNGADLVLVNEARYGAPSRYALERARSVAQRKRERGSALALIYCGNNEFLHLTPEPGAKGRGRPLMSAQERQSILQAHRANLEAAVGTLRASGIEVVLSTIPVNLRDWPPSYSIVTEEAERKYACGLDEPQLEELLRTDPELAQAHFRLGRLRLRAGTVGQARASLVAANDHDGRPIRAVSAINSNIRSLAAELSVRLLDGETAFTADAPDGMCGNAQFWDDCHPRLEGYIRLAGLLSSYIAELHGAGQPPVPSVAEVERAHGIDNAFLADMYSRIGLYCYKHSDCWDNGLTLDLAESRLRHALALSPVGVDAHIALALVLSRRGDQAAARDRVRTALELDPKRALWLLNGREARAGLAALGVASAGPGRLLAGDHGTHVPGTVLPDQFVEHGIALG